MGRFQTTTVGDLRRALDEQEAAWTEEDTSYLGEFQHQAVQIPHWCEHDSLPYGTRVFRGYGPLQMYYDVTGLGFLMDQADEED